MANVYVDDRTESSISIGISGLEHPANEYDYFKLEVYEKKWGNFYFLDSVIQTYDHTNTSVTISTDSGTIYFSSDYGFIAYARYNGETYKINTSYIETSTRMADPPSFAFPGFLTTFIGNVLYYGIDGWSWHYAYELSYSSDSISWTTIDIGRTTGNSNGTITLNYQTTYYLKCRAYNFYGIRTAWSNVLTLTSGEPPAPPIPSSTVDFTDRVDGGFNLLWGSSSGATSYALAYKPGYVSDWVEITGISGTSYQLTGLMYGVTYDFKVRARNNNGYSDYTAASSGTTDPKTPSISAGEITNSSIVVYASISATQGNYTDIQIERYDTNGTYLDTKTTTSGGYCYWSGLAQGTTFIFKAKSHYYINGYDLYSIYYSNSLTVLVNTRPSNFDWTIPKDRGGNINVTATEWNSFTSKINEFRRYKLGTSLDYSFTTMYVGSDIAAWVFNQAVNAIAGLSPPTPPPTIKSSGQDVYASYFNDLVSSLKSVQ